jgi:hypothetical protein
MENKPKARGVYILAPFALNIAPPTLEFLQAVFFSWGGE